MQASSRFTVGDIVVLLDEITGGRVVKGYADLFAGTNRFVVTKSSHLPGKAITETPGLVCGDPAQPVDKIGLVMTLTESAIELAGARGVDLIIAHHPVADAANSGGVPLKGYVGLYGVSVIELHEAFHGLHPGIALLHGHKAFKADVAYGGVPGNIMFVGRALEGIATVGDILRRLSRFMGLDVELQVLEAERKCRGCDDIHETSLAAEAMVLGGAVDNPVGVVLHIFPHTGFTPEHLDRAVEEHPDIDTVVASISRVRADHPLVARARERGLNFICGNSHAVEIYENWMPLGAALKAKLPGVELVILRERICEVPFDAAGSPAIREYAEDVAQRFLLPDKG